MVSARGLARLSSRSVVVSTGRCSPTPYSSTCNGSPLPGSAQISTWAMVVAFSSGVSRRPGASMPAAAPGRQPAQLVVTYALHQRPREGRRQQVGGIGQPNLGDR